MAKKYRAGRMFNKFLKVVIGSYMKLLFDYSIDNDELKGLQPPYIVIANHTNFWDPFLLSMCIPDPVYFITSDAYFRSPVLRKLLSLVGAIPKTKLVSDPSSIRAIIGVVKNNGIVGIFPEGRRNWDGTTLPLLRPTAKLIKSIGIPVVSILFKGAYLSMPRWSSSTRKGKLTMTLTRVLETTEINELSANEIFLKISESLAYDEYSYQKLHMQPYVGRKKAEKLELFLFCCPECKNIGSLSSLDNTFFCRNCGYKVNYSTYGFFDPHVGNLYYDNPKDWNSWQLEQLESQITRQKLSGSCHPIITDNNIKLRTGNRTGSLKILTPGGILSLYLDKLEYCNGAKIVSSFPIREITGLNIQFNNQLEFICKNVLYRFSAENGIMPAYKWVKAIEAAKRLYGPSMASSAR